MKKEQEQWYFDLFASEDNTIYIALSEDGCGLDDQLHEGGLPEYVKEILIKNNIDTSCIMEAVWESEEGVNIKKLRESLILDGLEKADLF